MNFQTSFVTALRNKLASALLDARQKNPMANAFGTYWEKINGVYVSAGCSPLVTPNMLPTEGLNNALDTWLGSVSKPAGWYIALYSGAVSPAANWTAANFASNASEITSEAEGYTGATRPQWVKNAAAAGGVIDNIGSEAAYAIVCTTTINVNGVGMLSSNSRGGTAGIIASSARYGSTRTLSNGDNYEVGYRTTFVSS